MGNKLSISDFRFSFAGYGHYLVYYTSPVTGKFWSKVIDDMPLIDATKGAEKPKMQDLIYLKRRIKSK